MIRKLEHGLTGYRWTIASFVIAFLAIVPASAAVVIAGVHPGQQQQTRPETPVAGQSPPAHVLSSSDEDYEIGASDVIEIRVEDAPELSGSWRVSANGTFPMPYLGRLVVKGKTTDELQRIIIEGLKGRYLKNPQVTVVVKQINSRAFFIQGAIRSPGVYYIEGRPSVIELITLAGGLLENHGSAAFIIRKNKLASLTGAEPQVATVGTGVSAGNGPPLSTEADSDCEFKTVNINSILKGKRDENMFLVPGDIVNIPIADLFFVAGEVHAPGSFQLKEGTTLRQAISLAQGTTFEAAKSRGVIFRDDPSGKRGEIAVDIDAIMNGKKEDVRILPNDIIIVPNSRLKSITGGLLRALGVNSARLPIRY